METIVSKAYAVVVTEAPVHIYAVLPQGSRQLLAECTTTGQHIFIAQSATTDFEGGSIGLVTGPFENSRVAMSGAGKTGTAPGESAFDTWKRVNNLPDATEADFIDSLKGEEGPQGAPGLAGAEGKSPYYDSVSGHWKFWQDGEWKDGPAAGGGTPEFNWEDGDAIVFGYSAVAGSGGSIAIGDKSKSSDSAALAIGCGAVSSGRETIAIGCSAKVDVSQSAAIGSGAYAAGGASFAIGYSAKTSANYSIALGCTAKAEGSYSIALGYSANATASDAAALGSYAKANANNTIVIGSSAQATERVSIAIGASAKSLDEQSIAIGAYAYASGFGASVYGHEAQANAANTSAFGAGAVNNDTGTAVINAYHNGTTKKSTQLYLIAPDCALSNTYLDGEAGLGYVSYEEGIIDGVYGQRVIASGCRKLSELLTSAVFSPTAAISRSGEAVKSFLPNLTRIEPEEPAGAPGESEPETMSQEKPE